MKLGTAIVLSLLLSTPAVAGKKKSEQPDMTMSNKHYTLKCYERTKGACDEVYRYLAKHKP